MKVLNKRSILIVGAVIIIAFMAALMVLHNANEVTIGISYSATPEKYEKCIEHTGAEVKELPIITTEQEAREILSTVDGLVMTGGNDIDPALYGDEPSDKLGIVHSERDISDKLMLQTAMDMNMPVLCVCRGMQMLNIVQGGTLYQDIPSEYKTDIIHKKEDQAAYHSIEIAEDSKVHEIIGVNELEVNSFHHQSVKSLGADLRITAWAEDGTVEAIEVTDEEYVIGIQFHPEKYSLIYDWAQIEFFEDLYMHARKYKRIK